jgi:copper chaperone
MTESTYTVTGMSCGHCVSAVTEEVTKIDGVEHVDVDLDSGRLVITSASPLSDEEVTGAVSEAGFELSPAA